ncbi:unnamed protein product, partial [marine sediment metagenome]
NINRYRTKFFVFNDENKELKVIGSTCVNEWFGLDILKALEIYTESLKDLAEDEDIKGGGSYSYYGDHLDFLIKAIAYVTDNFNLAWKSVAKYEQESTSASVSNLITALANTKYDCYRTIAEDFDTFKNTLSEDFIEKNKKLLIENYLNIEPKNDFEHNIKNNLFYTDDDGQLRDFIESRGVVCWSIWKANNDLRVKNSEQQSKKESEYIGTEKEKLENLKLTINKMFEFESQYGLCKLMLMTDESGNSFKWYNSGNKSF